MHTEVKIIERDSWQELPSTRFFVQRLKVNIFLMGVMTKLCGVFAKYYTVSYYLQTRILVTNAISYLPQVDLILVLKDGQISEQGSYEELISHQGPFADFVATYLKEADEGEDQEAGKIIIYVTEF